MIGAWDPARHPPLPTELNRLRYRVLSHAFRVHTVLGPAMKEDVYRRCLAHSLREAGFRVDVERRLDVEFDGLKLHGVLKLDVVVNDTILIELKARDVPLAVWNAQVLSYLWHSGLPLGYVVNFHVPRLRDGIRPFINLPRSPDPLASRTT